MAANKRPRFDFSLCVSCSVCVLHCPISCIALTEFAKKGDRNLYPALIEPCIGCGTCAKACPVSAITMEDISE